MLEYREIRPSHELQAFVDTIWTLRHDGADRAPQRVVPDGRAGLILNWDQPFEHCHNGVWKRQPRYFLAGQIEGPLLLRPSGPAKMMGVEFHPHGAAALLGRPMDELTGAFTAVDALSPRLAEALDQALDSTNPLAAVEAALLKTRQAVRQPDLAIAEAVRRITGAKGGCDLIRLARDLGMSIRQFERRFQAAVGLRPKLFCRMQRFNGVYRALSEAGNWVDAAIACGYYDQAHLIRDCKSLSGQTPAVLLADDADLARHFYGRYGVSQSSNTAAPAAV